MFNLYYSYYLLTSTINHVDNYYYNPNNWKKWSIVSCIVSQYSKLFVWIIIVIISTLFVKSCSNRFKFTQKEDLAWPFTLTSSIYTFLVIIWTFFQTCKINESNSSCKVNFHWGFLSYYKISEYLDLHSVPMLTLNIFMIICN